MDRDALEPKYKILKSDDHLKHRTIGVGLGQKFALIGFSGNSRGIGYILIYGYQFVSEIGFIFDYLYGFILRENCYIVNDPKTIQIENDGSLGFYEIKDFLSIKIGQKNLRLHLDEDMNNALIHEMNALYKYREKTSFDAFAKKNDSFTNDMKIKMYEHIEQNVDCNMSSYIIGKNIEKVLSDNFQNSKKAIKRYKNFRNQFFKESKYPKWNVSNCAEIHVITGFRMIPDELKYLQTFRKINECDNNSAYAELEICPPCSNCKKKHIALLLLSSKYK